MTVGFWQQALASYLFAYIAVLSVVLGAMIQVMIAQLSGARWFDGLRPLAMRIVGVMPLVAILALPILVGVHALYPWADLARIPPDLRDVVARKHAWLNVPFFVVRSVVYLVVWCVVAERLRRRAAADPSMRALSAAGLIVVGITLTFASFDWVMSLEPSWYSTVYGIYVFAGGILASLALMALVTYGRSSDAPPSIDPNLPQLRPPKGERRKASLGKLIFTFAIFWAYIWFSQYIIIWIGNLPSEVSWYASRTHTGWVALTIIALLGQFAIPFLALIGYTSKRRERVLALTGACILFAHVIDNYWLVMPSVFPTSFHLSWTDFVAIALVGGVTLAAAVARPL
jgi:hypothetical protein